MGRPPRIQVSDVVYHVYTRGVRKLQVFEDPIDYQKFEALLGELTRARRWLVHCCCQMPNHYHVLLRTPAGDISEGMCWLNGVYARWFNARHAYEGHVFERRFNTVLVRSNIHLLSLAAYIPLNPVRAGLCRRPADWPWSSYRATIGRTRKPWLNVDWLLAQFGRDRTEAQAAYARYVESQMSS